MVFLNINDSIINCHRNMNFYDDWGDKSSKPNTKPIIYQFYEFQSIDTLSLNPIDAFNPNLLCYISVR